MSFIQDKQSIMSTFQMTKYWNNPSDIQINKRHHANKLKMAIGANAYRNMSTETPQNLTPDILVITQDINKQETKFPARYITFIFMGYYAVVSLNLS